MSTLLLTGSNLYHHATNDEYNQIPPPFGLTEEELVKLYLFRDLRRLGWNYHFHSKKAVELVSPIKYEKESIRSAMSFSRKDGIISNQKWIEEHLHLARKNLATGEQALTFPIIPRIEVCDTQTANDIFRLFRYTWSSPVSEYVGRRIRLIIRNDGIVGSPIIGLAALGSSIIHIPERDRWIGWDKETRTERIIYMMDAYVLGAIPPYNALLGGKLISYILASNEVRDIFYRKYSDKKTIMRSRKAAELALIITTSLYGHHSSQYSRIKYGDNLLYHPIGITSGYGSSHISQETFKAMRDLLASKNISLPNRFGDGPNWRMRVIRTACDLIGVDPDSILKHSFSRGLFAVPLARNWKEFLNGSDQKLDSYNLSLIDLVEFWRNRWLNMRLQNPAIIKEVTSFLPGNFKIN